MLGITAAAIGGAIAGVIIAVGGFDSQTAPPTVIVRTNQTKPGPTTHINLPTHTHAVNRAGPYAECSLLVCGRARAPRDVNAPGIQITSPGLPLEVTVGNRKVHIAYGDWNTIVGTTAVRDTVVSVLDPSFTLTDTTRNRFQYLADRIVAVAPWTFGVVGVVASPTKDEKLLVTIALINRSEHDVKLARLGITVKAFPPLTLMAQSTLHAQLVQASSVYFLRVALPLLNSVPKAEQEAEFTFKWIAQR